jgi:hypothetical protein
MATLKPGSKGYQTAMSTIRNNAVRKLIANHEAEYKKYYTSEAKKAGVYKYSKQRVLVLEKQLKQLQTEIRKQKQIAK